MDEVDNLAVGSGAPDLLSLSVVVEAVLGGGGTPLNIVEHEYAAQPAGIVIAILPPARLRIGGGDT
ncbi:MAG: hypothetical protein ACREYF_20840 [Gammaproteobacteria bacterium]